MDILQNPLIVQFTIGVFLQTASFDLQQLLAGRRIARLEIGGLSAIVPMQGGIILSRMVAIHCQVHWQVCIKTSARRLRGFVPGAEYSWPICCLSSQSWNTSLHLGCGMAHAGRTTNCNEE